MRTTRYIRIIALIALFSMAGAVDAAEARTGRRSNNRSAVSSRQSNTQRSITSTSTGSRRSERSRSSTSLTLSSPARTLTSHPLMRSGGSTFQRGLRSPSGADFSARRKTISRTRTRRDAVTSDRRRTGDSRRGYGSPIITRDGKTIPFRSGRYQSRNRYDTKRYRGTRNSFSVIYVRPFYNRSSKVYLRYGSSYGHTSTRYIVHLYYPADYPAYTSSQRTLEGTLTTLASNEVVLVVSRNNEKVVYALEMTDEHLDWVYESGELPIRVVVIGHAIGARNGYPIIRIKSLGLMP